MRNGGWWKRAAFLILCVLAAGGVRADGISGGGSALDTLLPVPRQCEAKPGGPVLPAKVTVSLPPAFAGEKPAVEQLFREAGCQAVFAAGGSGFLAVEQGDVSEAKAEWEKAEAYRLQVTATGIRITAVKAAGVFYALQTLRQLLPAGGSGIVPGCDIVDYPALRIRGIMHDLGRNFQSVALLKEQLDVMGRYKYNVFHFHLTDNHGWRLESKRHPELQAPASFSRRPGCFYTQADFKEIVAYCQARHITVIPELDVPGHTVSFRKAFNIKKMSEPKVRGIVTDLLEELCTLAPPEVMPYVHIGTDEVKADEKVDVAWIVGWAETLQKRGRQVIGWHRGIAFKTNGGTRIQQLWAQSKPLSDRPYIDSQNNYINHVDPFELLPLCAYVKPCRYAGDGLGAIMAFWPDNNVNSEKDIILMNAVYPAILMYSDPVWRGRATDRESFWYRLPGRTAPEFAIAADLERRALAQRDRFFVGKPFPYLRQCDQEWRIIGPFDHKGKFTASFPVEKGIKPFYEVDGKTIEWRPEPVVGATVYLRHFWGSPVYVKEKAGTVYAFTRIWSPADQNVGAWIGFNAWSRSGRRGAPTPKQGQWSPCDAKLGLNGAEIAPPQWKQPGVGSERTTLEIPFVDEDYHYRAPTQIRLKKGWNTVLLKIPFGGAAYKWVYTFMPVRTDAKGVLREVPGLRYDASLEEPRT